MKRNTLRSIQGENCHYCRKPCCFKTNNNKNSATVEHLINAGISPTFKRIGGFENCVIACYGCNQKQNENFRQNNKLLFMLNNAAAIQKKLVKNWTKKMEVDLAGLKRKICMMLDGEILAN